MSYADHLLHLGFHSLEYRRVFLDLLNIVDLDASAFFLISLSPYGTRGGKFIKLSGLHHAITLDPISFLFDI